VIFIRNQVPIFKKELFKDMI